jgi:hypothetical protein
MGAIGMCLTGAFPLALMDLSHVIAAVLSQPALPLKQGTAAERAALGLDTAEIDRAVKRADAQFLALRFSADDLCRKERFDTLERLLGSRLETCVIPSGPGTPFPKEAHAVLSGWFHSARENPTREAFERVVAFLARALR